MRTCSFGASCCKKSVFFLCGFVFRFISFYDWMIVFFVDVTRNYEYDNVPSLFASCYRVSLVWLCSFSECSSSRFSSKKKSSDRCGKFPYYSRNCYPLFSYIKSYLIILCIKFSLFFFFLFFLLVAAFLGLKQRKVLPDHPFTLLELFLFPIHQHGPRFLQTLFQVHIMGK